MPSFAKFERSARQEAHLKEYNHLRSRILCNAPALHGPSPRVINHGYNVVTTRTAGISEGQHTAALVAYCGPFGCVESVLLRKSVEKASICEALQNLLDGMEHDLGVVIDRTAPGEVIEPQPGNTDNDTTPKAARPAAVRKNASPPQFAIPAQRENSSRSRPFPMTVPAPRRTLLHKKSAPFVVSEASRDRRSSHDISMEYLRSQGFTQPGPSSVTSTSSQQVYRKSAPPGSAQLSGVLSAEAGGW